MSYICPVFWQVFIFWCNIYFTGSKLIGVIANGTYLFGVIAILDKDKLVNNHKINMFDIGSFPELCITFHLHYISFALHLKNLPCQHEMHAMSQFKCHALHLHFMK